MNDKEIIMGLNRSLDAANNVIMEKDKEILSLRNEIMVYEMQKKMWEQEKVNQLLIIQKTLSEANTRNNSYLIEINSLKEKIRNQMKLENV